MIDVETLAEVVATLVDEHVAAAVAPLLDEIAAMKALAPARGERGADGKDGKPGRDGADGSAGRDGRDGDPGSDGKDGADGLDGKDGAAGRDGADGKDGRDGEPGQRGKEGAPGRDGIGASGALIDRNGDLVLTMSDGAVHKLGAVVGRDGADGRHGTNGEKGTDGADGNDGRDGVDGQDGLGFDDLAVEHDGARSFVLRFSRGEKVKEFAFAIPVVIDQGVYKAGSSYEAGDAVTWAGSLWIARSATSDKPGDGESWRLAVKKGRDGRDGTAVR